MHVNLTSQFTSTSMRLLRNLLRDMSPCLNIILFKKLSYRLFLLRRVMQKMLLVRILKMSSQKRRFCRKNRDKLKGKSLSEFLNEMGTNFTREKHKSYIGKHFRLKINKMANTTFQPKRKTLWLYHNVPPTNK